jgi:hypothetical protein
MSVLLWRSGEVLGYPKSAEHEVTRRPTTPPTAEKDVKNATAEKLRRLLREVLAILLVLLEKEVLVARLVHAEGLENPAKRVVLTEFRGLGVEALFLLPQLDGGLEDPMQPHVAL